MRQWHRIGVDHRDCTIQHILHGYARQMQYRESDGSYFPYRGSTGSTWLTAYILKVFTMAHLLVNTIDLQALCSSAAWLIRKKQGSEGHFFENAPIYTPAMQGGYLGSEQQTSLTAFILIALKEAELMCAGHVHPAASPVLPGKAPGQPDPGLQRCHQLLRPDLDWTHWPTNEQDSDSLTTVEATAYALLQKVKLGQLEEAHGIARWLVQARAYGGGYESTQVRALCPPGLLRDTHSVLAGSQLLLGAWSPPCHTKALLGATGLGQDGPGPSQASKGQQGPDAAAMVSPAPQTTVVGMQALAGYQLALPPQPAMELRVQVSAPKQHVTEHWAIDASNAYLSRTSTKKFLAQNTLEISANGMGIGTVTMLTVYYTLPTEREGTCQAFHLDVAVQDTPKDKKKRNFIDTFWLRIRARAQGGRNATMTIVDISMLTGFYPDLDDLKKLTNVVEQYIFLYETKSTLSNSSVILYFSEMSSEEEVEIWFRIHQHVEVGLLQPAAVTASRRCSRFYNLPAQSGQLKKICQKEVCKCAEEN
ncbi:venom factor [Alligator mississippiensis]|uniref:venom factor n=1 Tax=Alligator mississippiensis TaxID=8496 RepID=UPI0028777B14|nr:venom factor [Alligator mississippiensis]